MPAKRAALTVLIAERHLAVAQALSRIVSALGDADVTARVVGPNEVIALGVKMAPDVAIIDLDLSPDCHVVSTLRRLVPDTRVIVMADKSPHKAQHLLKALAAGAVGAIYKEGSVEDLSRALMGATSRTPVVPDEAAGLLLQSYVNALTEKHHRDLATIEALAAALEVRDYGTGQHLHRVTQLAEACLSEIDRNLARNEEVKFGFMLHDVGKIGVPDAILSKPGPLDDTEWNIMRTHPELGVRIVEPIGFGKAATDIILHHHERWDGKGYPDGLAREDIPLAARAFSVVDVYDAMTSDRPYRDAMPRHEVIDLIRERAGTQFDPDMVDVLVDLTQ
jgi:putative nucleotidyltransferase with HDIG domain